MGWDMYSKGDISAFHLRFLSMSGVHLRISADRKSGKPASFPNSGFACPAASMQTEFADKCVPKSEFGNEICQFCQHSFMIEMIMSVSAFVMAVPDGRHKPL